MRWLLLIALAVLLPFSSATAQTEKPQAPPKPTKTPTSLPPSKAEPENGAAYGAPVPAAPEGPSDADVGPVQAHFVRAAKKDDLATQPDADDAWDNKALATHREKIALDKNITVPKIHDVQNDGPGGGSGNHALQFELDYLNWGAITGEQLAARRGHYFTITWENDGPKADFTTRFEYREVKSQQVVRTLVQKIKGAEGATRSYFAVVDKAYLAYGPVVSWRFTVLKGDTVVAEAKSFIW